VRVALRIFTSEEGLFRSVFELAGNARVKSNAHAWTFRSNGRIVRRA
jgi:hypothetical protein